jgi:uncharacterized protein YdaU (DUF1376 family)
MNVDLAQELLDELGSSLENLETQHAALFQFLKDKGMLTDDQFAPYLAQAGKASSVRWRAAHIRLESLFRNERQKEEKLRENEQHQTDKIQNQEREAETTNEVGSANAALQSDETKINGPAEGALEQSISETDNKQDEHATSEDKKQIPTSNTT